MEQITFDLERVRESRLAKVDFKDLMFGREFSDHMLLAEYYENVWKTVRILPYQNLSFSPASCVFHYGQAIFEGLKAYKTKAGEILLFRPDQNFERMNASARRMCMAEVPEYVFLEGIKELIRVDANWVPDGEGQALYIRPFLIADDAFLGVKPSKSYKFMVITSPTSNYYRGAVSVKVEKHYTRACEGGIGAAKAAANYAASLLPAQNAQADGYDQLIWTDAKEHRFIEESGTMNIMFMINGKLITPSLDRKTILPGITRDSILTIARDWGIEVEERQVEVQEVIDALKNNQLDEAFGVGTAATIAPIKNIGFEGEDYSLSNFENWNFANKAKNYLEAIKRGEEEDKFGWTVTV